jgi:hypothetical protein
LGIPVVLFMMIQSGRIKEIKQVRDNSIVRGRVENNIVRKSVAGKKRIAGKEN